MKSFVLYMALFSGTCFSYSLKASLNPVFENYSIKELPAKTICIKHPMANDAGSFFSTTTNLFFEVYKPGTKADYTVIIEKLQKTEGVQNVTPGAITGDYYGINITLKTVKDKDWFAAAFKKAGLENIKINNNDAIALDKL